MRIKILTLTPIKKLVIPIPTSKLLQFLLTLYNSYMYTNREENRSFLHRIINSFPKPLPQYIFSALHWQYLLSLEFYFKAVLSWAQKCAKSSQILPVGGMKENHPVSFPKCLFLSSSFSLTNNLSFIPALFLLPLISTYLPTYPKSMGSTKTLGEGEREQLAASSIASKSSLVPKEKPE